MKPDNELDLATIKKLLQRVVKEIHSAPNRVRYTMNGFVIGVGGYIKELTKEAIETSKKIGDVYIMWSMKHLIADGKIEATGEIEKGWKEFDVRKAGAVSAEAVSSEAETN